MLNLLKVFDDLRQIMRQFPVVQDYPRTQIVDAQHDRPFVDVHASEDVGFGCRRIWVSFHRSILGWWMSEQMRLSGMAAALRDQLNTPDIDAMPFLDRLGLMVEREEAVRGDRRLTLRLHTAKLRLQASMANLDYGTSRGLDKRLMLHLAGCQWIRRQQNVIITGPTGVGKSQHGKS